MFVELSNTKLSLLMTTKFSVKVLLLVDRRAVIS